MIITSASVRIWKAEVEWGFDVLNNAPSEFEMTNEWLSVVRTQ